MSNTMSYKGYTARIEYDDEDGIFFGRIAGISDGVGFHANTVEDDAQRFMKLSKTTSRLARRWARIRRRPIPAR